MTQSLQLGPLVLPLQLLLVLVTVALAMFAGKRAGNKLGIDAEPLLFRVAVVAVIAARLAFVLEFRDAYFKAPLDILDIRDGGWSPEAGLIVAWLYALALSRSRPALRNPIVRTMSVATAIWLAGTLALAMSPDSGAKLPAMQLARLDRSTVSLSDFDGRPTVVNLWATWCPPCQREMPLLQQAQADHPEVNFVFLNQGESADQVRSYLQGNQLALRNVLLDTKGQAGTQFKQKALPTTLFFDARGRLAGTRIGELSRATLAQRLDTLSPLPQTR